MIWKTTFDEWATLQDWKWLDKFPAEGSFCYLFANHVSDQICAFSDITNILPIDNADNMENETYIEKTNYGYRLITPTKILIKQNIETLLMELQK